jgi:hypothetical protein
MKAVWWFLLVALSAASMAAKEKPRERYVIPVPPAPDFKALDWLVGDWTGKTTGRSAPGEIRLSVNYDLDKHFMVFREEVSLSATKSAPASKESWLGILSPNREGAEFVLRAYSSNGFIARYGVTVDGEEIRWNPEGGEETPPGWLFRRLIDRTNDTEFTETVQVAPPAKAFFEYYTAKFTRVEQPEKPAPAQ